MAVARPAGIWSETVIYIYIFWPYDNKGVRTHQRSVSVVFARVECGRAFLCAWCVRWCVPLCVSLPSERRGIKGGRVFI